MGQQICVPLEAGGGEGLFLCLLQLLEAADIPWLMAMCHFNLCFHYHLSPSD